MIIASDYVVEIATHHDDGRGVPNTIRCWHASDFGKPNLVSFPLQVAFIEKRWSSESGPQT